MTTQPLVSVVIPCYNYGHFLPAAVGSALGQGGVRVEVIVVDDASPDGSVAVANELAAADDRIRVVAHPSNAGHIATYNDGLALATGDYVVLLSADDQLAPGSLGRAAALLERHPNVGLVYGRAVTFTDEAPDDERGRVLSWSLWGGQTWLRRTCRTGNNRILNPEVVMRTSVLERVGGYDPALPHSADMDLWMRASLVSDIGRVNGTPQAYYRAHGANMHLTDFAGVLTDMRQRANGFHVFFDGPGARLEAASALRDAALRSIAREAMRVARIRSDDGLAEADRDSLAEFASECWPRISGTAVGRAYQRRDRGPARAFRNAWARQAHGWRWRVRYHLSVRLGL